MSGDTVTSRNGLQFTNDNKFAYIYSGDVSVASGSPETTMLEFSTNSEYLRAKFEIHGTLSQIGQNQIRINVQMNGIDVIDTYWDAALDSSIFDTPSKLIIPPFTDCAIILTQSSGVARTMQVTLTAKVGMAPRVGNLVE